MNNSLSIDVINACKQAKQSSFQLANLKTATKDHFLNILADNILERQDEIIQKNLIDCNQGQEHQLSSALLDRLLLNEKRILQLSDSVREIIALPDPVGEVLNGRRRPNGLLVFQERVPLGVVMVIFESRPNVIIDITSLAIKSGNAAILKGGRESLHTNLCLLSIIQDSLQQAGLPLTSIQLIDTSDREVIKEFLQQSQWIDVVIPRGGEALIQWVSQHSRIPIIKHDKGLCHLFVDESANPQMVEEVVVNSKVQRPGVCNAIETLLLHKDYPQTQKLLEILEQAGVELRLDEKLHSSYPHYTLAQEKDWSEEYLDLILSVKEVEHVDEAIDWINQHGSKHTDVILSSDLKSVQTFEQQVDTACVIVNASSRFHDGGMLGLGAEVGISNQKIHVRGAMGIQDLTCLKYHVQGGGQIRQ